MGLLADFGWGGGGKFGEFLGVVRGVFGMVWGFFLGGLGVFRGDSGFVWRFFWGDLWVF